QPVLMVMRQIARSHPGCPATPSRTTVTEQIRRRPLSAWERAEVVVEGVVLFDDDHDVTNRNARVVRRHPGVDARCGSTARQQQGQTDDRERQASRSERRLLPLRTPVQHATHFAMSVVMSLIVRRLKVMDIPPLEALERESVERHPSRIGWLDTYRRYI